MTVTLTSYAGLKYWVQDKHLDEFHVAATQQKYHQAKDRLLVIDDFLKLEVADHLHRFFQTEALYEKLYRLRSKKELVSQDAWEQTKDNDRFYTYSQIKGIKPQCQFNHSAMVYLKFHYALVNEFFVDYFSAVCGEQLAARNEKINAKFYQHGDFIRPHTDATADRILCANLYLSPGWCSAYGGELMLTSSVDGETIVIEPLCNRLVLFDPRQKLRHWVAPFADGAKDQIRYSFSFWYKSP